MAVVHFHPGTVGVREGRGGEGTDLAQGIAIDEIERLVASIAAVACGAEALLGAFVTEKPTEQYQ